MPLSANTVISQPLSGGQFTSLLHSTLDGVQFLFAGTDTGKLHQVFRNTPNHHLKGKEQHINNIIQWNNNNRHIGMNHFVHYREVVLFQR